LTIHCWYWLWCVVDTLLIVVVVVFIVLFQYIVTCWMKWLTCYCIIEYCGGDDILIVDYWRYWCVSIIHWYYYWYSVIEVVFDIIHCVILDDDVSIFFLRWLFCAFHAYAEAAAPFLQSLNGGHVSFDICPHWLPIICCRCSCLLTPFVHWPFHSSLCCDLPDPDITGDIHSPPFSGDTLLTFILCSLNPPLTLSVNDYSLRWRWWPDSTFSRLTWRW